MHDHIVVTPEPLDLGRLLAGFAGYPMSGNAHHNLVPPDPEAGAFVIFTGNVRAAEGDRTIPALQYEHYPGMAERELQRLVAAAREQWPLRRVAVVHRTGTVHVGEPSVIVIVSAAHRAQAFEAARFLIDQLKATVPIWKATPA